MKNRLGSKRPQLNLRDKDSIRANTDEKSDPRCPLRNCYELKEMIATFAALLWLLFGDV